MQFDLTFPPEN